MVLDPTDRSVNARQVWDDCVLFRMLKSLLASYSNKKRVDNNVLQDINHLGAVCDLRMTTAWLPRPKPVKTPTDHGLSTLCSAGSMKLECIGDTRSRKEFRDMVEAVVNFNLVAEPCGRRDAKWLEQTDRCRESLKTIWDVLRTERKKGFEKAEVPGEQMEEYLTMISYDNHKDHLVEIAQQRESILRGKSNPTAAVKSVSLNTSVTQWEHEDLTSKLDSMLVTPKEKVKTHVFAQTTHPLQHQYIMRYQQPYHEQQPSYMYAQIRKPCSIQCCRAPPATFEALQSGRLLCEQCWMQVTLLSTVVGRQSALRMRMLRERCPSISHTLPK